MINLPRAVLEKHVPCSLFTEKGTMGVPLTFGRLFFVLVLFHESGTGMPKDYWYGLLMHEICRLSPASSSQLLYYLPMGPCSIYGLRKWKRTHPEKFVFSERFPLKKRGTIIYDFGHPNMTWGSKVRPWDARESIVIRMLWSSRCILEQVTHSIDSTRRKDEGRPLNQSQVSLFLKAGDKLWCSCLLPLAFSQYVTRLSP